MIDSIAAAAAAVVGVGVGVGVVIMWRRLGESVKNKVNVTSLIIEWPFYLKLIL